MGSFFQITVYWYFLSMKYKIINHSLLKTALSVPEADGIQTILIIQ
jgi:hypothetical protein